MKFVQVAMLTYLMAGGFGVLLVPGPQLLQQQQVVQSALVVDITKDLPHSIQAVRSET